MFDRKHVQEGLGGFAIVRESFPDRPLPIAEYEEEMLGSTFAEWKPNSRLACQIKVKPELDGLIVHTLEARNWSLASRAVCARPSLCPPFAHHTKFR